jgi:quercetin dioxygenase-like cupin family protein
MKKTGVMTLPTAFALCAVAVLSYAAGATQEKMPVNRTAAQLTWRPIQPESPIQVAILWGDMTSGGEYGMLLKLPAGIEAGMHSHTADYHAVNLQGTWIHTNQGRPSVELGPGSYVMQPGKQDHNDACTGSTECVLFVHQHGANDLIPAQEPGNR